MKFYLRLCLFAVFSFLIVTDSYAQEATDKKRVAVYVTGEDVNQSMKKVFNSKLGTAVTSSGQYVLVETGSEFLKALELEIDRQTSGDVRSNQIVALGRRYGVKLVIVADVSEMFDEFFIVSRLINLETGLVEKNIDVSGAAETMDQLNGLSQKVATSLFENVSNGRYSDSASGGGSVESFTVNGVTFEMVKVDGGTYSMGSYSGYSSETPVHSESISTFYIGKTEVTQALWAAVMGNNPSQFRGENRPVENVSWYDCQEFVERLSRLTGRIFRLPTEAEWEYAARGGNRSRGYTYSGSNDIYRVAWYSENSGGSTHPVAQKLDNELGIYDMSGNVWEWTSDNYSSDYSSARSSSNRVHRGGGWNNDATNCRVAFRYSNSPGCRNDNLGLRLAL